MVIEQKYMARALELAALGRGRVSPNPMVGAVIVAPDGRIIGEGYHRRCGEAHAEVNAVASVRDHSGLHSATMYVTLEPCSHYGKTPPCAKLIIDSGIRRVVVGAADPFKQVAGRGVAMLRAAGIEVVEGVMAEECRQLNARFMTSHELQRPFVTLKWAQSSDKFMDCDRQDGCPAKFSTTLSSMLIHRLRSLHDAIAIGSETALADDPRLDCRLWPGKSPLPIVFDRRGRINPTRLSMPIKPVILSNYSDLKDALSQLYAQGITSILVEGGPCLLNSFIESDMWDVAQVETSPTPLSTHGRKVAPQLNSEIALSFKVDNNVFKIYSRNPLFSVKNL